jgi:PBP1b-binding outer membrane lipoprotein LpoB
MKKIISILLAVVIIATVFIGCGKSKSQNAEVSVSAENAQEMLEFAMELEKSGQHEAAASIYQMIPDATLEAAAEEGQELIDSMPEKQAIDSADEARDMLNDMSNLMK